MRNLFCLSIFVMCFSPTSFASNSDSCGKEVVKYKDQSAVRCQDCKTTDDIAKTGAAVANAMGKREITVLSHQDRTVTMVQVYPAMKDSGWSFFGQIQFGGSGGGISYNRLIEDPDRKLVTSDHARGTAAGSDYQNHIVPSKSLELRCEDIRDAVETEKAIAQNIDNTESIKRIEGESIERQLEKAWLRGIRITNGGGGRTGRSWSCEADDKGNCKDNRQHHQQR